MMKEMIRNIIQPNIDWLVHLVFRLYGWMKNKMMIYPYSDDDNEMR